MSARSEILGAAHELADGGRTLFSPIELIERVRQRRGGNRYTDMTLRTHIVSTMCANAPANEATGRGEFVRVSRGLYRLNDEGRPITPSPGPHVSPEREPTPKDPPSDPEDWYWEGNVQALVVAHLARLGWSIRRVADTSTSEHGHDIDASFGGQRVLIEVKGFPTSTYARGPRQGAVRAAGSLGAQARTYFSSAMLSGCLMRADNPSARIVLAFPDKETFRALALRVAPVLESAGMELWLVSENGSVRELTAGSKGSTPPV